MKAPYLQRITFEQGDGGSYPFSLPFWKNGEFEFYFDQEITILTGRNGIGKSSFLSGIAAGAGFGKLGGSLAHNISAVDASFAGCVRLSWTRKATRGYYFRADKLSDMVAYLDGIAGEGDARVYQGLNDRSLNYQSHGQAISALIKKYAGSAKQPTLVILDEPETSLSIASQIDLAFFIQEAARNNIQFVIATHSPVFMAIPNAGLFDVSDAGINGISLERSEAYLLTRQLIKEGSSFFS